MPCMTLWVIYNCQICVEKLANMRPADINTVPKKSTQRAPTSDIKNGVIGPIKPQKANPIVPTKLSCVESTAPLNTSRSK